MRRSLHWPATPWGAILTLTVVAITVQKVVALGTTPPGLYADEASIGYNAWAIAHHGVDEHGAHLPLYFRAFGEFKNPLYIYLLAPFTWFLPLSAATIRLPAALCGIGTCAAVAGTVWTATRSRAVTWLALVTAAVTPWLLLQSRVAFEVPVMTLCLALAALFLARAAQPDAWRGHPWLAGLAFALAVFAYTSGRLLVAVLVGALLGSELLLRRRLRSLVALAGIAVPVAAAYALLVAYAASHPGAILGRFDALSIGVDSPDVITLGIRLLRNYVTYLSPPFLFTQGDENLRHNTGYGGQLLVVTLPALLAGLWWCVRRRRELLPRLLLAGVLLGPLPAALTYDGTPHAVRSAGMLPFLLIVVGLGWAELLPLLRGRRALAALTVGVVLLDGIGATWDLYARFPDRTVVGRPISTLVGTYVAQNEFDAGEQEAIVRAHRLAGGRHVWLSEKLDQPAVQALVALLPVPVAAPSADPAADDVTELATVGVSTLENATAIGETAQRGDILVLAPSEAAPQGAREAFTVYWDVQPDHALPLGAGVRRIPLVVVYALVG